MHLIPQSVTESQLPLYSPSFPELNQPQINSFCICSILSPWRINQDWLEVGWMVKQCLEQCLGLASYLYRLQDINAWQGGQF